jgi:hypothetical protein
MTFGFAQINEARHGTARHSTCDRLKQILVGRQKTRRRGPDFEQPGIEPPRLRIQPDRRRPIALAVNAMTSGAVLFIHRLPDPSRLSTLIATGGLPGSGLRQGLARQYQTSQNAPELHRSSHNRTMSFIRCPRLDSGQTFSDRRNNAAPLRVPPRGAGAW